MQPSFPHTISLQHVVAWQYRGPTFEQHLHFPQFLNVPKIAGSSGRHGTSDVGGGSHSGTRSGTLPPA